MIHLDLGKLYPVLFLFLFSCAYNDLSESFDCTQSDLSIVLESKQDVTGCKSIDGSITVSASGGEGPYDFSLNAGVYQTSGLFSNLGPGSYTVTAKDLFGCTSTQVVELTSSGSTLVAVAATNPDTDCFSDNGSITINASQGKPPYKYQFDTGSFSDVSTFENLKFGNYTVTVKDGDDCPLLLNVTVPRGNSSISYANDIKTILDTKCNISGCHNGSLGSTRDWSTYATAKANASGIQSRTANKTMPPGTPLTQNQIDQITCWVDDGALNN
ncbi:MAG: hypothetical protein AABY93_07095 [Bacteroidota bacterium]